MDNVSDVGVKLEIYEEWYWWRGYQQSTYASTWRGPEITEGPGFYTETAFPSLKPDIDLFGVPRRSRKQRGWHQVAVPFLGRPSERPGKRAHFRPPAKASDIPPELFDNILDHLTDWVITRDRRERRRMLARCALVCRYWSVKCQESLFEILGLNSRENALQLLEFMRTPISAAPSFVKWILAREAQAVSCTPWLHLMSVISDRAHQELEQYRVVLKGPLAAGQRMRSIHHGVPRSLPGHFSRHIKSLYLTDIHFKELDDLMHLVGEMPDLKWLSCERVTWGSLPTALPRRRPRNAHQGHSRYINVSECGPRPAEASVFLAASVRCRYRAFFSPDDFTHVLSLARELENRASTSVKATLCTDSFYVSLGQNRCVCFYDSRQDSHPLSQQWHIDTIAFDNRTRALQPMGSDREPDWSIVDAAIASFPVLERMVVGLDSREDMVRFEEEVAMVHMSRLLGSGMLKYALWDSTGVSQGGFIGTWLRASLDSDDTEFSGCSDWGLHEVYR